MLVEGCLQQYIVLNFLRVQVLPGSTIFKVKSKKIDNPFSPFQGVCTRTLDSGVLCQLLQYQVLFISAILNHSIGGVVQIPYRDLHIHLRNGLLASVPYSRAIAFNIVNTSVYFLTSPRINDERSSILCTPIDVYQFFLEGNQYSVHGTV